MLRVTIEILPHGSTELRRTLQIIDIANDGTGTIEQGNYKVRFNPTHEWIEDYIKGFPRKGYTADKLLKLVLDKKYAK